ncbi:MAG: PF20097 family protein [Lachnospiraceae bacterium]|nr:PF20097 family protein [Lachnospiraceae bacterium]
MEEIKMQCPYCGKEMIRGHISVRIEDGARVSFYEEERPMTVFDALKGAGQVTAAKYKNQLCKIDADYCGACKKMIIDTEVSEPGSEYIFGYPNRKIELF